MTLILTLPEALEKQLSAEATKKGLSLPDYVLKILLEGKRSSPAETVQFWKREGLFNCLPIKGDSAKLARKLRKQAERRSRD